jgi:hypothetical protein
VVDGYTVVGLGAAVWVAVWVSPVGAGATDLDGAVVASADVDVVDGVDVVDVIAGADVVDVVEFEPPSPVSETIA